jgi:integrase/recombinase XerD
MMSPRRKKGPAGHYSAEADSPLTQPPPPPALDRYMRSADVGDGALWRGNKGTRLSVTGLRHALAARARQAGIEDFTPHMMRRAMATRWMSQGGSETGLMAVGGWADRAMIARYVGAAQEELAQQEFDRLGMGIA